MKRNFFLVLLSFTLIPMLANASGTKGGKYKISVTNLHKKQVLTMPVASLHSPRFALFTVGQQASLGLQTLAEDGVTKILINELTGNNRVYRSASFDGHIAPGETKTLVISTMKNPASVRLSLVSMLATTNDAFIAFSKLRLPLKGSKSYKSNQFDAGSEANTELCEHVPGPPCGSHNSRSRANAEGSVEAFEGVQGVGDLSVEDFNINGPAAMITIEKMPF